MGGAGDNNEEDNLLGLTTRRMTCKASDDNKEDDAPGLARRRTTWGASDDNKEDNAPGVSADEEDYTPGPATTRRRTMCQDWQCQGGEQCAGAINNEEEENAPGLTTSRMTCGADNNDEEDNAPESAPRRRIRWGQ
mmetsp:Transcript_59174/g.125771  ORF Transcript_59174/g.125771 Transcript_59174/m.125771 type:complete len:136 (+) Transcript_59174:1014-1421(+)